MPLPSVKTIATTLWTHKKKSIFGAGCVGLLIRYLRNRELDRQVFRGYCQQALQYGDANILATIRPRRVTVLVRDTKARTSFEKHALPLLNLAGLQVDVLLPQEAKQLTTVASVLTRDDAEVIYIVGNDETVSKVLTGLLHPWKEGINQYIPGLEQQLPAVVPPVSANKKEIRLLPHIGIFLDGSATIRSQCENAMAVIRGMVKDANVLQVKVKDLDPLCIFNAIHLGRFAETQQALPRYWYWGFLKGRFGYLWNALTGGAPDSYEGDIRYVEPCMGCSKCYVAPNIRKPHWLWQLFIARPKNAKPEIDYSKVTNDNCGVVRTADFQAVEIIVKNDLESASPAFTMIHGPAQMGETAFMTEGWARCRTGDALTPVKSEVNTIQARELEVNFKPKEEDPENENQNQPEIIIGGELMKLADFSVKTIPRAIQLITSSPVSS